MIRCFSVMAALFAFCLSGAAGTRLDRWNVVGPGGGGALYFPTVSPHDSSRVLMRCDMTGSYISNDSGANWRMFNLRTTTNFFVFDPVAPDTIYAANLGLYRSTDAGVSWKLVYPNPDAVTGVRIAGDHGEANLLMNTGGATSGGVTAMAIDPADSTVLYAAFGSTLRVSTDWGATWTTIRSMPDGATKIYVDPASPAEDRTLYVIGTRTVSVREGGQWRQNSAPPGITSALADAAIGFPDGGGPAVVYAVSSRQIFISEDAGATWRTATLPGTNVSFASIATSLRHPESVYVSYSNLTEPSGQYFFGVAHSADFGRTWSLGWKSVNQGAPNVTDGWITPTLGSGWSGNPISLGVAPNDPDICYGSDLGRVMRTMDGGATWRAAYSNKAEDGNWTSNGADVTTSYGVHFDPFNADRMFITYTDIVLWRSENGGRSWMYSGAGVPSAWRNTTYWMEFDPEVPGRVWAVMSRTHDLPRPKMWRSTSVSTYDGGVMLSEDGGKNWKLSNTGMPPTAATHILLDPTSPVDARVLYVAGVGRGVFKSVDGGKTWTLKNSGIEGDQPLAWRLTRDANGLLYVVVARRSENGSYGNANDGAVYVSSDGAESWAKLTLPDGVNGPVGLTVDPDDASRLYLATWGRFQSTGDVNGGVYVSTDGGLTWQSSLSADQHVYDVTIDRRTGTLYASGFESSAWRSDDRGATWTRLRGFNFKWGHRVVPDPADAGSVYVTTFGGSVWHGPAAGDPEAAEDIGGPGTIVYSRE